MEKNNPDTYIPHSQPKALYILAFVEVWERFSYYGLRALLILYMCSELQYSDSHAYGIYGIYFSLVYASTVIGGYLADTYLGNRKAIYLGGIIILIGHICLALPIHNILTFGLGFIIVGTGFFKANITSLLGQYYHANDPRRDAGFTLFYMAINIGGFLAPIICGLIGKVYGWHYGFAMAGIGMLMSILVLHKSEEILKEAGNCPCEYFLNNSVYLGLSPYKLIIIFSLISVPVFSLCIQYYESMSNFLGYFGIIVFIWMIKISFQCKGEERKTMLTLMAMLPFYTAFFASFEQAGASMTLFTERHIDRVFFGLEVPAAWFQSLNPFLLYY